MKLFNGEEDTVPLGRPVRQAHLTKVRLLFNQLGSDENSVITFRQRLGSMVRRMGGHKCSDGIYNIYPTSQSDLILLGIVIQNQYLRR